MSWNGHFSLKFLNQYFFFVFLLFKLFNSLRYSFQNINIWDILCWWCISIFFKSLNDIFFFAKSMKFLLYIMYNVVYNCNTKLGNNKTNGSTNSCIHFLRWIFFLLSYIFILHKMVPIAPNAWLIQSDNGHLRGQHEAWPGRSHRRPRFVLQMERPAGGASLCPGPSYSDLSQSCVVWVLSPGANPPLF